MAANESAMSARILRRPVARCFACSCARDRLARTPQAPLTPLLFGYQPETQFFFLSVDRLNLVNLYSIPTEMAKFTSNCP